MIYQLFRYLGKHISVLVFQESMKMMGMANWLQWLSWFTKYFVFLFFTTFLMTLLLCPPYKVHCKVYL